MGAIGTYPYAKSLWSHNPIPRGCVLYLPLWSPGLRGSVFKSIDHYRHTCTVTGALWGQTGRTFDGDDKITWVTIPSITNTGTWTMLVWIYPTDLTTQQVVLDNTLSGTDRNGITIEGDLLRFGFYDGSWHTLKSGSIAGVTSFIFVAAINNAQTGSLYINNVAQSGTSIPYGIGVTGISTNNVLTGTVGEVWIYERVLTLAEITHIYNKTKWRY